MVFPVFFQKDFPKMMYRITSVDNVPLVEDMTIQQFEIWIIMIIQLNCHIQLSPIPGNVWEYNSKSNIIITEPLPKKTMNNSGFYSICYF